MLWSLFSMGYLEYQMIYFFSRVLLFGINIVCINIVNLRCKRHINMRIEKEIKLRIIF
jgi:hypothetical protein